MTIAGSTGDASPPPPGALARPPAGDIGLMALAVAAVSTSAPLVVDCAAPKIAVAFWRNAFAVVVLLPFALSRPGLRRELVSVRHRGPQRYALVAGGLLAGHFACWIPSLSFTSVASATALVATQPIWAALVVRAQGERLPRVAWAGIWLAVLGVALVTGVDVSLSGRHALGDGLALLGGLLAAAYVSAGSIARQALSTTSYTTVCYSLCALVLLAGSAAGGVQLGGFRAHDWWLILALTAGPQLLGHSVFNRVLRTTSATVVSLAILFEVPGAVLLAWAWLGQTPQSLAVPGLLLLVAGIAVVLAAGARLHREQRVELAD